MTDHVMPGFVYALERRLREEASAEPLRERPRPSRRRRPRITIAVATASALALAVVAAVGLSGPAPDTPTRADGPPLILKTAAVDVQDVIEAVQSGGTVRHVLGADATLTEARPIPAFGSVAYVLTGDRGWCLVAPDDALSPTADPVRTGGLTCQTLDSINRFGIALIVGHNVIAALPQGVPAPTLTDRDGTTRHLTPSDQGVVTVGDASSGAVLALRSAGGETVTLHVP
jgi:hypothetical protein